MCGICAGLSSKNQIEVVLSGLKQLEYRGYDSCGVAYLNNKHICISKAVGQIKNLKNKTRNLSSNIVIGHTRWATHGVVNENNAHPHISSDRKICIVHNGIIENFKQLKEKLASEASFYSQTDTEVFANLIAKQVGSGIEKLISACQIVDGSFAIAMLIEGDDSLYLAKRNSPLYVAFENGEALASSDISVFANKFCKFYTFENDEFAKISFDGIEFFDIDGKKIQKKSNLINNSDFFDEIKNEKFFMKKEIKEQPIVLKKSYYKYFSEKILEDKIIEEIKKFNYFYFIACGTAFHSALLGEKFVERYAKKSCKSEIASEFRYANHKISKNCLYVFVSQSGETADTIACAKLVKENGGKVMCVTNVPYCTLNSLADFVLPTFAGKEHAVASTKAYVGQVFVLLFLALKLSKLDFVNEVKKFILSFDIDSNNINFSKEILKYKKIFFIGRGQDYVTSLEASLKLKEIAYINCVGMSAGELKHGTLALIDDKTLVFVISTVMELKEKIENNIQEIKARGGKICLVSNFVHDVEVDYFVKLSEFEEFFMPIVSIVPFQQLALETCIELGYDPDKPRNLAKAVTVE